MNETNKESVLESNILLPAWKAFLKNEYLTTDVVKTSYISMNDDGTKVTYPAEYASFYETWEDTNIIGEEYFIEGNMTDYDPRGRDFYRFSQPNQPNRTFYGPYFSPGDKTNFYAATISKPCLAPDGSGTLDSIISIDINLNYEDNLVDLAGINSDYSYIFISSLAGLPLFHSKFKIQQTNKNVTFTKLEFSRSDKPLEEEPTSDEAKIFNDKILPEIMKVTDHTTLKYNRFGHPLTLTATPINIKILWPETGEIYKERRAIACIVIDKDDYVSEINDSSQVLFGIFLLMGFFLLIIVVIMLFVWFLFYKIASYSLKPIKILNKKIKVLLLSNSQFDLSQSRQNITSKDAKDLYESGSELMITRRFAKNDIDKNDALAIMDFADAYIVLNTNEQAKGICLNNIANIHFINKDYKKASQNYHSAAKGAKTLYQKYKMDKLYNDYK